LPDFVQVKQINNVRLIRAFMSQIDKGEAEVIALAFEESYCVLVLDDKKAKI